MCDIVSAYDYKCPFPLFQSKHTKPDIGMEQIKAMTNSEKKETAAAIRSKYEEPNVGKVDARAVEQPEKRPVAATKLVRYASIRAIENNSYSEMRNVVAYWILFSLVSLFELAFVKAIDW
ncbi:hypothetical protein C3L33_21101, partial [Rhododendron williamsianum]